MAEQKELLDFFNQVMARTLPPEPLKEEIVIDIPDDIKGEIEKLISPSITYKGKPVKFSLAKDEFLYRYFKDSRGVLHCYTPHHSTDGDYFAWDYVPVGKGSRSGKATRWTLKNLVRCALRNVAKQKAMDRARGKS